MTDNNTRPVKNAMVLAAGLGVRMRPITDSLPKPLIKVDGRTIIDRAIDRLEDAGIIDIVINVHHLGDQIVDHLNQRSGLNIEFSREVDLLETGGGVKKALPLLGDDPFFVINGDAFWLNGPQDAIGRINQIWDADKMDALLLLHSTVDAYGYSGRGDFTADPDGKLIRRHEMEVSPWLFTGVQILHPKIFEDSPEGAFSLNLLYDRAIEQERLYGLIHDGELFHVGTPEGQKEAEEYLGYRYSGKERR